MPSFFAFQQGSEARAHPSQDASPLLGRFRAVPAIRQRAGSGTSQRTSLLASLGYGTIFGSADSDSDVESIDGGLAGGPGGALRGWARAVRDLYVRPQQLAVKFALERWWRRWLILAVVPAAVAVAWCALPVPQYDFEDGEWSAVRRLEGDGEGHRVPGHGEARVEVNFWFFLFVYYGFYNVTALMWITKVFNIYSLNWYVLAVALGD